MKYLLRGLHTFARWTTTNLTGNKHFGTRLANFYTQKCKDGEGKGVVKRKMVADLLL